MRKQVLTFKLISGIAFTTIFLFLGGVHHSKALSLGITPSITSNLLGGTIADIYQGKTGEIKVIFYQEGEVTLTLYSEDGTANLLEETYSAPNVIHLSLASFPSGKYKLVVEQGGEVANFDINL